MRWSRIKKLEMNINRRTIKKFLIFPKTIQGETRWLEFVKILQYKDEIRWDGEYVQVWRDMEWVD